VVLGVELLGARREVLQEVLQEVELPEEVPHVGLPVEEEGFLMEEVLPGEDQEGRPEEEEGRQEVHPEREDGQRLTR